MISPINEWWIVGGFAALTVLVVIAARLFAASPEPAILYGNGLRDDAPGLRAWQRGESVQWVGGAPVERQLHGCTFLVLSDWSVPDAEIDHPRTMVNCEFIVKY